MGVYAEKVTYSSKLAERYVKALWRVAVDTGKQNKISDDMALIEKLINDASVKKVLSVAVSIKRIAYELAKVIKDELEIDSAVYNMLKLLIKNDRAYLMKDICNAYNELLRSIVGRERFYITVSNEYEKSDMDSIVAKIKDAFSQNAECIFLPCKEKFYGVRIQHKSRILDYSVESKVARLLALMKE